MKLTNPENGIVRAGLRARRGSSPSRFSRQAPIPSKSGAAGFKTTRQDGIVLAAGDTLTMEIEAVTIGATEQVTVNATGPLLQTEDAEHQHRTRQQAN